MSYDFGGRRMKVKCAMCGFQGEIFLYKEWFFNGSYRSPDIFLCDTCKFNQYMSCDPIANQKCLL